jgi:hypothetical protein
MIRHFGWRSQHGNKLLLMSGPAGAADRRLSTVSCLLTAVLTVLSSRS